MAGTSRTFIVRVSDSGHRVVVENVRTRQRAVVFGLGGIGARIEAWLAVPAQRHPSEQAEWASLYDREDSVSRPPYGPDQDRSTH